MRLKIPKGFNIDKWLEKLEAPARVFVWIFVMILAILTVVPALSNLTATSGLRLLIYLILFFIAITIVSSIEIRHARRKQTKSYADTRVSTNIELSDRNRWILIAILALAAIILAAIFVPRQLKLNSQGYQTFYMAFAAIGAWVTGIALAVFAYQQYKLRQTEHRLLFEPQLILTAGTISIPPPIPHYLTQKPYQIKWTVFVQNTSQIPILIEHMEIFVKLAKGDAGRQSSLTPYCHVAEPDNLRMPFEVSLMKPQHLVWVVEGSAGDVFDYVSGEGGNRDFVLIFRVFAKRPQDPKESIFYKETISWGIHVPKDANWVSKTPFLDVHEKQD